MSELQTITDFVQTRFAEAFGPPHNILGRDSHWKFQAAPAALAINILLNGTRDVPALWLFDAHQLADGVYSASITDRDQVDGIIKLIRARIQDAADANLIVE